MSIWASESQIIVNNTVEQSKMNKSMKSLGSLDSYDKYDLATMKKNTVPMSLINRCVNSNFMYYITYDKNYKPILMNRKTKKRWKKLQSSIEIMEPSLCDNLDMDMDMGMPMDIPTMFKMNGGFAGLQEKNPLLLPDTNDSCPKKVMKNLIDTFNRSLFC